MPTDETFALPRYSEKFPNLLREQLRLFKRGEVTATRHFRIADQIVGLRQQALWWIQRGHLGGERRKPEWRRQFPDCQRIIGITAIHPNSGGSGIGNQVCLLYTS